MCECVLKKVQIQTKAIWMFKASVNIIKRIIFLLFKSNSLIRSGCVPGGSAHSPTPDPLPPCRMRRRRGREVEAPDWSRPPHKEPESPRAGDRAGLRLSSPLGVAGVLAGRLRRRRVLLVQLRQGRLQLLDQDPLLEPAHGDEEDKRRRQRLTGRSRLDSGAVKRLSGSPGSLTPGLTRVWALSSRCGLNVSQAALPTRP